MQQNPKPLVEIPSSVSLVLVEVSGEKRFEDTKDLSVLIDVAVDIFFFLLEQCTTGIC